jgi:hypothetical protein
MGYAEETFRSVILGVFNDFLDGDLEVIRTLLSQCPATMTVHPSHLVADLLFLFSCCKRYQSHYQTW